MLFLWFSLVLIPIFLQSNVANAQSQQCSANPVPIRIGNVTLGPTVYFPGSTSVYGVHMIVGNQPFAPVVKLNSADLQIQSSDKLCTLDQNTGKITSCRYESEITNDPNFAQRELLLGGFFDGTIATSSDEKNNYQGPRYWADTDRFGTPFVGNDFVSFGLSSGEILALGSRSFSSRYNSFVNKSVPWNFDRLVVDDWMPSYIGLNKFSVLLNDLYNTNKIPSRSWGFFSGWRNWDRPDDVQDGSLVLGGYDKAKIAGPFSTFPTNTDPEGVERCQFKIKLKRMYLTMSGVNGGTTVEISTFLTKDMDDGLEACIDPSYDSFRVQNSVRDRIMIQLAEKGEIRKPLQTIKRSKGIGIRREDMAKLGDLTVTIQIGERNYTVEHQNLVQTPRILRANGYSFMNDLADYEVIEIANSFPEEVASSDLGPVDVWPSALDPAVLGYPFLASNYLFVNHENDTFSLAPVSKEITTEMNIVPVLAPGCNPAELQSGSGAGLPTGVIAGIVVGISVLFIAIIWAFVFYRRRLYSKQTLPSPPSFEKLEADGTQIQPNRFEIEDKSNRYQLNELDTISEDPANSERSIQTGRVHTEPVVIVEAPVPIVYEMMGDLGAREELAGNSPDSPRYSGSERTLNEHEIRRTTTDISMPSPTLGGGSSSRADDIVSPEDSHYSNAHESWVPGQDIMSVVRSPRQ